MAHNISKAARQSAVSPRTPTGTRRRLVRNASRRRKLIAFGWYGGKYVHLDFILPHLPTDAEHFCDVYGGSAAVLINREPAPVETYNDLDSELVNFFAVLRDQQERLIRQIGLTPFSREELAKACDTKPSLSDLERARRFYVRARQTRTGLAQTSSEGRWAHCVLTSRAGMAGAVSRWLGAVEELPQIAQRLQRVQIENAPALEVIRRYDTPGTLFYLDPPYVHGSRGDTAAYGHEMTDADHCDLATLLCGIQGRAVLSGVSLTPIRRTVRRLASRGRRREAVQLIQGQAAGVAVDELRARRTACQLLIETWRGSCSSDTGAMSPKGEQHIGFRFSCVDEG